MSPKSFLLTADVHDSDVLYMQVWTSGTLVHEYCNAPTYFAEEYREITSGHGHH